MYLCIYIYICDHARIFHGRPRGKTAAAPMAREHKGSRTQTQNYALQYCKKIFFYNLTLIAAEEAGREGAGLREGMKTPLADTASQGVRVCGPYNPPHAHVLYITYISLPKGYTSSCILNTIHESDMYNMPAITCIHGGVFRVLAPPELSLLHTNKAAAPSAPPEFSLLGSASWASPGRPAP